MQARISGLGRTAELLPRWRDFRSAMLLMLYLLLGQVQVAAQDTPPLHALTVDATIGELLDDARARAVLEEYLPELLEGGQIDQARNLSLRSLQMFAPDVISDALLADVDQALVRAGAIDPVQDRAQATGQDRSVSAPRDIPAWDSNVTGAQWVSLPDAIQAEPSRAPVVLQLRREFALAALPDTFPVEISADQRYVLYVNGHRVAAGPARGDLQHWRRDSLDLTPWLQQGNNTLAAQVWSDGRFAPSAQVSAGITGFYLKAVDPRQASLVDTGPDWVARVDTHRSVAAGMPALIRAVGPTYYVSGGPETLDAAQQLADWTQGTLRDADGWQPVVPALDAAAPSPWRLVDNPLPQMRYARVASGEVVRSRGVAATGFPAGQVVIPAATTASVLVDAGRVLAGYPVLQTRGGAGAEITLTYTESLYDPSPQGTDPQGRRLRFANRARVDDGLAKGLTDTFQPDGGDNRFAPFWWRVWRFVEIQVTTAEQPLVLKGFETFETGYPFEQRGRFVSSDEALNEIWRIGWMTGLLDAHETYMDSAYWEQLQYIGDTRIQMLLSYDVAGDPRLAVQALDAFDASRKIDGLPQAAWPQSGTNSIPPFALLWIGSLHDFWMYQPDTAVVTRNLPGVRAVLDWYAPHVRDSGMIQPTPGWPFIDWREQLDGMERKDGRGPDSCIITLMYFGALREAADLEAALGDAQRATANRAQAERVQAGLDTQCWDAARGLYADTPDKDSFSQHANVLAVLYDVAPAERHREIMEKITVTDGGIAAPEGITGTTYYFSYYLARALDHAGMTERYLPLLDTWRQLLAQNFTTWPEAPDPSRSDTHAWSSHPTSGLLGYVAGIQPDAPGFSRVRVAPHLGDLETVDAAMAHPLGLIEVRYELRNDQLQATVRLPENLSGEFVWAGNRKPLHPGENRFSLTR